MTTKTYTLEIEVEVKITSYGSPARGPSFHSAGEPAEGPEFEIETITIAGDPESIEAQHKAMKAKLEAMGAKPESIANYDQFFADQVYDRILDKANEDTWERGEPDDY